MQLKKIRLLTLENWGKTGRHESRLPIPQHHGSICKLYQKL